MRPRLGRIRTAPVALAGPPASGATHQSSVVGSRSRTPSNSRKLPSGDHTKLDPMTLNSDWNGRVAPPCEDTRNILPVPVSGVIRTKAICEPSGENRGWWPPSAIFCSTPPSVSMM